MISINITHVCVCVELHVFRILCEGICIEYSTKKTPTTTTTRKNNSETSENCNSRVCGKVLNCSKAIKEKETMRIIREIKERKETLRNESHKMQLFYNLNEMKIYIQQNTYTRYKNKNKIQKYIHNINTIHTYYMHTYIIRKYVY